MANKRGPGDNRQDSWGKNQKPYKEPSQCASRSNPSQHNPEEDEEDHSALLRQQEEHSCSKKTSYCQSKPLNPYLTDQGPDEDEDDEDDDDDDDDDEDDEDDEVEEEDDFEEKDERSSTRGSYSNDAKHDPDRQMSTAYPQRSNRKLTEDKHPSQPYRNNSSPPKKK